MRKQLDNCYKTDVLVVDDKTENLCILRGLLKGRGYDVRTVTSGACALKAAESCPPCIVLMDINMPGMDGYETCSEMKKREALCDIPVIFVSGLDEVIDKVRAFESGGVDYLTKPVEIDEIDARIKLHVSLRRLRQALEERYKELRELEEVRDKLTHMIAHDLRNPLAVIRAGLDYLSTYSGIEIDEKTARVLRTADAQAKVLCRMLNDMLDVSRLEACQMSLRRDETDIETMLKNACANVVLGGRELSIEVPADVRKVYCDSEVVRRIMGNLLANAVKFTPRGGTIRIAAKSVPGAFRIEVRDSGPGIPTEFHEKIFEKFGRVIGCQPAGVPSTGLGLTFCRLAVEAHGGDIGVESTVGDGSTFWFTLPERDRSAAGELSLVS